LSLLTFYQYYIEYFAGYEPKLSACLNLFLCFYCNCSLNQTMSSDPTPLPVNPYSVAPLRGGQINGNSFTGGAPLLDASKNFTSTTTTIPGPPSFMAIRTSNVSNMMKIEQRAKEAPTILFETATDSTHGLSNFTGQVHRHFIEYGMDSVFYFKTSDNVWVNILDGHTQFSREEISYQSEILFKNSANLNYSAPHERYDMYDLQNLRFSASYILSSISAHLRAQVLTKVGLQYDNGPVVWMYVMGLVQSSSYRSTKLLQKAFEERKLKTEPGENVTKHTIKLRDDYVRLRNANMVPHDALMTIIDSLVDCSTSTFAVWAATKRIEVGKFLKENAGKTVTAMMSIPNAPTVETICNEADDEYQSLFESGLWIATESKRDKDAAPTAFLLEKLSKNVDRLMANQNKKEGTCWTCGKEGHKSPDCPTKNSNGGNKNDKSKRSKDRNRPKKPAITYPEWQKIKPKDGESETTVRDGRTFMWCEVCAHWRTTHGTSGHIPTGGSPDHSSSSSKKVGFKQRAKTEETSANLACISEEDDESSLVLGAWCGISTDSASFDVTSTTHSKLNLGVWITKISKGKKLNSFPGNATCSSCGSIYHRPFPICEGDDRCQCCSHTL
jgi:Zinc knuckle